VGVSGLAEKKAVAAVSALQARVGGNARYRAIMEKRRWYPWLAVPWIIGLAMMAYVIAMTFQDAQVMLQYPDAYCLTPVPGYRFATLHLDTFCFRSADADVLDGLRRLSFVGLGAIVVPAVVLVCAKWRERRGSEAP